MKIVLPIFVFLACLAVSCLALKHNEKQGGSSGIPHPPPSHLGPPPQPPKKPASLRDNTNSNKVGWGSNGSGWGGNVPCAKPPQCLDPATIPPPPDIDANFLYKERLWYNAGGTCFGYNTFFRIFNSRYAKSQREINEMCPASVIGVGGAPDVAFSGTGVQFTQDCTDSVQQGTCTMNKDPATYDKGVDVNVALASQDYYLLDTDNRTYVLYYTCDDYVHGDLLLLSTRPYVNSATMETFLSYFSLANISTSQAQAAICTPPKFPGPYPYPFGWYPNSPGGIGWGQSQNGWQSPSPPSGGWSGGSGWSGNNGWSNNGWSDGNGWSNNGWSVNGWANNGWSDNNGWGPSNVGWGGWNDNGGSGGWGWDTQTNGWGSGWGKMGTNNEGDKKTEDPKKTGEKKTGDPKKTGEKKEPEAVAADVVAEFNL